MSERDARREAQEELEKVREHLRKHVALSGFSEETLADQIGVRLSSLRETLFERGGSLHQERLLMILETINVPSRSFFATLYDFPDPSLPTRLFSLIELLVQKGVITRDDLEGFRRQEESR